MQRLLGSALGVCPYATVRFADDVAARDARALIDDAFLCLFETSRTKDAQAILELGYAQGRGRYCVVLHGERARSLTGFAGDRNIAYKTLRELRQAVEGAFVEWLGEAFHRYTLEHRTVANVDSALVSALGASLLERDFEDEYTEATAHGFSEEQVEMTMAALRELGMARPTDTGWTVTELGRRDLPRLLAPMRRPYSSAGS